MACISECTENNYFLDALNLFLETQWLYNSPVTNLLTSGSLDLFPKEWLNTLQTLENQELNDFVVQKLTKPQWSETLKSFVEKCRCIDRLPSMYTVLPMKLPKKFKVGLSHKKQHEIVHLAHLVHTQCAPENIKVIVDLGAGLGYVCQLLYHLYGYQVLGLERNPTNVNNARSRQRKMYSDSLGHVKYSCCDLTCNSVEVIEAILHDEFKEYSDICLIGLHACGDLSIHASKIFCNMKAARLFVMIPCCYHKLSISKSTKINASTEKQCFNNFPLSDSLKAVIVNNNFDVSLFLRRPFLRLACQESADRWNSMSTEAHCEHAFYVLARALLQLYATKNGFFLKKRTQKGTRKSQCLNFETYVKDSLKRYIFQPQKEETIEQRECLIDLHSKSEVNIPLRKLINNMKTIDSPVSGLRSSIDIHEKNITELWGSHSDKLNTVEIYSGLQLMLQAPAESLVLQDRLCWMQEQGLEAKIVPVMNRQLSPRSCAVVSRKR